MTAIGNLVQQHSLSAGAGAFLLGAVPGCRGFAEAFGTGGNDMFFYFIRHRSAPEWEIGTGHMADAVTLVRDSVIASSAGEAKVAFSAGEKDVVNDIPAARQLVLPAAPAAGDLLVYDGARWQAAKADISGISGLAAALAGKAAAAHSHATADVTGLSAALAAKAAALHTHAAEDITGLGDMLETLAPLDHSHAQEDITGLESALAAKAPAARAIATTGSLGGGGDLTADRTLALAGDEDSPGAGKYYGTDAAGAKGFHPLPEAPEMPEIPEPPAAHEIAVDTDGHLFAAGDDVAAAIGTLDAALRGGVFHQRLCAHVCHFNGAEGSIFAPATSGSGANAATAENDFTLNAEAAGILRLSTGTTASGAALRGLGAAQLMLHAAGKNLRLRSRIRLANLTAAGSQEIRVWGGVTIGTAATTAPASVIGIYWYYDKDSANWQLRRRNGSAVHDVDTGIAVAADTWYDMELRLAGSATDSAVAATLYIDGTARASVTQLVGAMSYNAVSAAIQKTVGTTARFLYLDYEALFTERA